MPNLLNSSSVMMCQHGGTVQAVTSGSRVSVGGSPVLRATDTFTISGCVFNISGDPHPCVRVEWPQPNQNSTAMSDFTLSEESLGFCVAGDQAVQGTVVIVSTQTSVTGT
jgi:uncharacterized Zn-binding protein involved in type VI secretion